MAIRLLYKNNLRNNVELMYTTNKCEEGKISTLVAQKQHNFDFASLSKGHSFPLNRNLL